MTKSELLKELKALSCYCYINAQAEILQRAIKLAEQLEGQANESDDEHESSDKSIFLDTN